MVRRVRYFAESVMSAVMMIDILVFWNLGLSAIILTHLVWHIQMEKCDCEECIDE
jgi:hypothetical protein